MLLKIALFILLIFLLAKVFRRRNRLKTPVQRSEVDRWVDQELARELARKLAIDHDGVRRSLQGNPDPDVVGAIEHAVRSIELCYAKAATGGDVDVRLDVTFEDGSSFTTNRQLRLDDVPQSVRDEYRKTGGARVYRPYLFPWSG
jgi:hypothetical protein